MGAFEIDHFIIDDGSKLLIKSKTKEYLAQGYDVLWTPAEYNQMLEKARPKPKPEEEPKL